jgi:long-chain acyl-CoA synthetase
VPLFIETIHKNIFANARKENKYLLLKIFISINKLTQKLNIDLSRVLFKQVVNKFGGNLKNIISGAAPIDYKLISDFKALGINIWNGYGISESSPVVSVENIIYHKNGSVGKPIPGMKVKIINQNENGIGEVSISGIPVMKGYLNNTKENKRLFNNGYFNTEDLGYLDDQGYLYIVGRKKNLIITSDGKNISPEELEQKISNIDIVQESLVSLANINGKSLLQAEVYLNPQIEENQKEEILKKEINKLNKKLPLYKNIKHLVIRNEEFEKTTTKKIKRY